jgi:hypothetical protein
MMPIDGSLIPLSTIVKHWITGWLIERWTQGSFFPMGFFNAPCMVCGLLVLWLLLRFKKDIAHIFFMVCAGVNLWLTYLPIRDLPTYLFGTYLLTCLVWSRISDLLLLPHTPTYTPYFSLAEYTSIYYQLSFPLSSTQTKFSTLFQCFLPLSKGQVFTRKVLTC